MGIIGGFDQWLTAMLFSGMEEVGPEGFGFCRCQKRKPPIVNAAMIRGGRVGRINGKGRLNFLGTAGLPYSSV
jgi:hypothetical protein